MAQKVGADLWHMNEINGGHPGCFAVPGTDPNVVGLAPAGPRGNSSILVNKLGRRYMNERGGTRSHSLGTRNLDFNAAAMDWSSVPLLGNFRRERHEKRVACFRRGESAGEANGHGLCGIRELPGAQTTAKRLQKAGY